MAQNKKTSKVSNSPRSQSSFTPNKESSRRGSPDSTSFFSQQLTNNMHTESRSSGDVKRIYTDKVKQSAKDLQRQKTKRK